VFENQRQLPDGILYDAQVHKMNVLRIFPYYASKIASFSKEWQHKMRIHRDFFIICGENAPENK
jgi:hypothetical protein